MINPLSTYRLQFHAGFTLTDFQEIIPYLQELGVTTIYAAPIFEATPGSTHGYDALDPHKVNPEIGTIDQLQSLSNQLKQSGMYWLQDIVPNHMAFDTRNPWIMDILEKGRHSRYASFFDASWNSSFYKGKLMVPFLGSSLQEVVSQRELLLVYEAPRLVLRYYDAAYPLGLFSYKQVLESDAQNNNDAVQQLLQQISAIQQIENVLAFSERFDELLLQFASLMTNESVRSYIDTVITTINQNTDQLQQLAEDQLYRLCHWQETDQTINYRRFFTINGLICLNIQDEKVFDHFHRFIKFLSDQKIINGFRIDHIDGLYRPTQYLNRLKNLAGNDTYIVAEKIFQPMESLPEQWHIQGTTGYDFLSIVNNILTDQKNGKVFTRFYQQLVPDDRPFLQQLREKKAFILYQHMGGELENLYQLFMTSALAEEEKLELIPADTIKKTIGEFLIYCPVYRFYGNRFPLKDEEQEAVHSILEGIRQNQPRLSAGIELLEYAFLKKPLEGNDEYNKRALHFYQRCMQFSGPLMAKGVEDTLMYTFNRFIAHNEVGDSPGSFGISIDEFHQKMMERSEQWSLSLNTTATHDTKRGEDARARLNVLTDLPEKWMERVSEWIALNKNLRQNGAPDANDEYFIYQSLLGAYPMPGQDEDNFLNRFKAYLQKAVREAKVHSNWAGPNKEYEDAIMHFAEQLLHKDGTFWKSFAGFHREIAEYGILNSLVQVLLKYTCPGIPDLYQGTELWDLSFVDPDNRRAVHYQTRTQFLNEIKNAGDASVLFQYLWEHRYNGQIKLWLVHRLLQERKTEPDVWAYGDYIPLSTEGRYKEHILAFVRRFRETAYIIIAPLHVAGLLDVQRKKASLPDWKDTQIKLPFILNSIEHLFEQQPIKFNESIKVKDLLENVPFAVLKAKVALEKRSAGILAPIISLPSSFGIGDLGPEAKTFADFLYRTNQRYWQLLPLNPIEQGQGFSPYSSISSNAGNTLLISPELLAEEGLLSKDILQDSYISNEGKVDYNRAGKAKEILVTQAWVNFQGQRDHHLRPAFDEFCRKQKEWLDDFAVYMVLKQWHEGRPWYEWAGEYKHRDERALQEIEKLNVQEIKKIKWMQFVFFRQWHELKNYCNKKGIQIIGDLPFYVSYDSVDVWSHRNIFKLDEEGNRLAMAGVPPDAFSEDGQLWGMPVFNWEVLKGQNFDWWIRRLQTNKELFDVTRLDHFRAFSAYWEVPAHETTARNGKWQKGPGAQLFKVAKESLGALPFIAEDLGDIDEPVYKLRDQFELPGMNVLQFAFGSDMPRSSHTPHNYKHHSIVYTGTHDNNTARGWYKEEKGKAQKQLEKYTGKKILDHESPFVLCRLAYASVADTVILPIQDVLGLDEGARINTPSSAKNNWNWRLRPGQITTDAENNLREWTKVYNRI